MDHQHIYFEPWRGPGYDKDGLWGRKVLIVGESHYDEWDGVKHYLPPSFTQECVQQVVDGSGGARYWPRVRNRLSGEEHEAQPQAFFWNKVAFYNFIQSPVDGGPGARPTPQQWAAAVPALSEVLSLLRPDRVLFTGDRLWDYVLATDGKLPDIKIEADERSLPLETFSIPGGHHVFVTHTAHPRSSKFGRWLTPFLKEFTI
jgi:hypothetical protein